jgi:hypothetical protein
MLVIFANMFAGMIAILLTLVVALILGAAQLAKSAVNRRTSPRPRTLVDPPPNPMLGVGLGLAPTLLIMLIQTMSGVSRNQTDSSFLTMLMLACFLVSVICCFGSGFILFQRRTALAIVAGVLFMLLNAVFSFWFGCAAVISKAGI